MLTIRRGTVYLVGAGPGDAGLITVRGRALIDVCDAIVYDALVNPEVLEGPASHDRPSPELHFVGKRAGDRGSTRQEDITALLIRLARAGKSVVRLKGGDPFVFGRGGEEAQALALAGVPFEVVPGVTAGIAAPAYAGIPVTHRGLATAVTFVTGHEDPTKGEPRTNWSALAAAGGTLVLYMAVRRLAAITEALLAGGLAAETPAAAIARGTDPTHHTLVATLATIADRATEADLEAPVITVIGPVVALRESIRWFDERETRPLRGRRILVTRASAQANALSERLRALGAAVTEMPATRIEPLDRAPLTAALTRLADYRFIVFTSQNAVRIVWDALRASGRDARALSGLVIAAVGPATSDALAQRGLAVDVAPVPSDRFVAEAVGEAFRERPDVRGARVLYPVAEGARTVLIDALHLLGATVDVIPIYRSVADGRGAEPVRDAIARGGLDLVTLTSASGVQGYVGAVGTGLATRVKAVSIGPLTSQAARAAGIAVAAEAKESTLAGLVDAVVAFDGQGDGPG